MKRWLILMLVCGAAVFAPNASAADIQFLSLTDTPDPQTAGSWVQYIVVLACSGGDCPNATVTFLIPAGGTFQSATSLPAGTCTPAPPQPGPTTITCALGTMAAGGRGFEIWVSYAAAGMYTVSGTAATTGDTNLTNNAAMATTTITPATAVTFRSLAATRSSNGVLVRWRTASETDTLGFHVYRQVNGKRVRVNGTLIAAKGRAGYSFLDRKAPKGKSVRYWVQVVNLDGTRSWHGPARVVRT